MSAVLPRHTLKRLKEESDEKKMPALLRFKRN